MDYSTLNIWAIIVASISAFVIGGVWYGPLFGRPWQKLNNLSDQELGGSNLQLIYGGAFLLTLLASFGLAMFIGTTGDWTFGLFAGFMTGVFFVSTFLGVLYLFERKPLKLFLINAGYCSVTFSLMGLIIGLWR